MVNGFGGRFILFQFKFDLIVFFKLEYRDAPDWILIYFFNPVGEIIHPSA
jgi:hypothetical protein